jgi:Fe(3+) dicitrate transport protein
MARGKINTACILFFLAGIVTIGFSQKQVDSIQTKRLQEIVVKGQSFSQLEQLFSIGGFYLLSGKKTEVINLQNLNANIIEKTARQIFAKVPGVFVYDMDGSGNQINISTRGLDPHRGWEFNTRLNGAITNSDVYGYPASHYSVPFEAVDRIELVRGTGALQYGAQFGGMLNYVTKKPDTTRAISFESINSAGSFGLLSIYNSLSATIGKFRYFVYYSKRKSDGYRDNAKTNYDAQSAMLVYQPTKQLKFTAELSRSNYVYRIPGPLTDSMFQANPRQATRTRNYFNPEIYIPSFTMDWKVGDNTKVSWRTSAVLGYRNSVQFDKPANVVDAINPATASYASRQVDIDNFNSYTSELRVVHNYSFLTFESSLAAGVQYFNNDLHRQQQGKGTTGSDFDLTLIDPAWGRDLHFKTKNVAFFAENRFQLLSKLSITPGVRIERGESKMTGTISYYDPNDIPNTIEHKFPLFGVNTEYQLREGQLLYAGWSQAYRPVIFKDIIPASVYEKADKNLKDAYGYNIEAGFKGNTNSLRWDVGVFRLQYNNRLGNQAMFDENNTFYLYRTNIGNSITDGAELFVEYGAPISKNVTISFFTSTALFNSRYANARIRSGNENIDVSGKKVESVPDLITRNGLTLTLFKSSISFLYSHTGESYADALNTEMPSSNGAVGLVPAYGLLDINATIKLISKITLRVNLNNAMDKQYFTKRPTFYPGPGVWSSDGRSVVVSVGVKI